MNSVPPVVMPHGSPISVTSTVYAPAPLSVTSICVFEKPLNHEPRWTLASGVEHSASFVPSSWNETDSERAGADSPRTYSNGTLTHGWALEIASPSVFGGMCELGGEAKMPTV